VSDVHRDFLVQKLNSFGVPKAIVIGKPPVVRMPATPSLPARNILETPSISIKGIFENWLTKLFCSAYLNTALVCRFA